MATELAKAYVQIVPSARGIKGALEEELGGAASDAGKSSGALIGSELVSKLKGVIAAAGIGKFIKDSLSAAGDIQQSYGGLDTIYGEDAAATLKDYSKAAAEAGISANTYAEQAVSFGAALKSAYGGDTVKAAEAANAAIMAMADNSAKFGTDIGSVQNAFQGFAKGNYTMLDNLKLGYGGTKTEMERLLADAEKLPQAMGRKFDLSNLGDVYTAIGLVQESLGVAGVAADEAKTTFSGSFGAMQAAATNFMASLSLGEGVDVALQSLLTSTSTFFFGNVIPLIGNLIASIPQVITTGVPLLIQAGQDAFAQLSSVLSADSLTMGMEAVVNIISGISAQIPELIATGIDMITSLVNVVLDAAPQFNEQGMNAVLSMMNGLLQGLPSIIEAIGNLAAALITKLLENAPKFMEMGGNFVIQAIQGIVSNIPQIVQSIVTMVTQLITTIGSNLPQFLSKGLEIVAKIAAGLIQAIPQVVAAIPQIVKSITTGFTSINWAELGINIIKGIASGLKNAGGIIVDAAKNAAKSAFESAKNFLGIHSPSALFRDQIGAMMAEGMAVGFEDNVPTSEIEHALQPMTNVIPDAIGGTQYSYGGFAINVYGAPGQNVQELADIVANRINQAINSRQAVFA